MNPHAALARKVAQVSLLQGTFRLRSGATSSEYFDKYRFEAEPTILREIAEQLAMLLPKDFDVLAGLEMGGIPIATMLSQLTGTPALFIRKKAKQYGTCRFAEGGDVNGRRLLVIEDVVTSGGQIIESVGALRNEGAIIANVACVIDRGAGGRVNLQSHGLALTSLFSMADLKE
jgi:orotate phosphoribosyltransferase